VPRQEDFQLRHGTAAQWTAANPVLDEGEIGVELDTHLIKAGDGTTTWNLLPYAGSVGGYIKPGGGIPESDMAAAVQSLLTLAGTAIQSAALTSAIAAFIPAVIYNGTTVTLSAPRPTAPVVYWGSFPSTPTNAQPQDIVNLVGFAPARVVVEYAGAQSLLSQAYPLLNGASPTGVVVDTIIAPGTGGGSGRRGAASTIRCGGGGGASGGQLKDFYIPATLFGANWSLGIPTAGVGGAAVTTDSTNGNNGGSATPSNNTIFQTAAGALCLVTGGDVGYGGTATTGAASTYTGGGFTAPGVVGAAASTTGGPGVSNGPQYGFSGPAGGSSGGGITSGNVAGAGAAGATNTYFAATGIGAAGVVDGAVPTGGAPIAGIPGNGAGSGAASITKAAQAGANALGYGVGGSGGGASLNGFASGAGGNGGLGFVRLIWQYT
jgi:hypothetical protein